MNIDALPSAGLLNGEIFSRGRPAANGPRRMGRMHGVHEYHGLVVGQGAQEFFIAAIKAFCFSSSSLRPIRSACDIQAQVDAAERSVPSDSRKRGRNPARSRRRSDALSRQAFAPTQAFKSSSCAALKKPALPPMSKLVRPSIPRCSKSLPQPRIVSSSSKKALATSRQLHPSSKSTKALARRVTRQAADPSRANAISLWRSSSLRKPPRESSVHANPPSYKTQDIYPNSSISLGIYDKRMTARRRLEYRRHRAQAGQDRAISPAGCQISPQTIGRTGGAP